MVPMLTVRLSATGSQLSRCLRDQLLCTAQGLQLASYYGNLAVRKVFEA